MTNKNEQLLDQFAGQAMQALIQKMPFYDDKGEFGKQVTSDELRTIKENLVATAYEYASLMMIARLKSIDWLKENESALV